MGSYLLYSVSYCGLVNELTPHLMGAKESFVVTGSLLNFVVSPTQTYLRNSKQLLLPPLTL